MSNEPRKATDVLLEMETKINALLSLVRTQDLNIKVLSNKLNTLMEKISNQPAPAPAPQKITVEAVQSGGFTAYSPTSPEKEMLFEPDSRMEVDDFSKGPKGFRRTSRPETYSGDNDYLKKAPPPPPPNNKAEVVVPASASKITQSHFQPTKTADIIQNAIPVQQRVVDKNGKSIFLAEVEIIDTNTGNSLPKTKTNGTGKWSTALPVGNYKVFIRKRESSTQPKIEVAQDIQVDGSSNQLDLPMIVIK